MIDFANGYGLLLGFEKVWPVNNIDLSTEFRCLSRLRQTSLRYDIAEERSWRQLDAMHFKTRLIARLAHCKCLDYGVEIRVGK